jgi:hypothetical protein
LKRRDIEGIGMWRVILDMHIFLSFAPIAVFNHRKEVQSPQVVWVIENLSVSKKLTKALVGDPETESR